MSRPDSPRPATRQPQARSSRPALRCSLLLTIDGTRYSVRPAMSAEFDPEVYISRPGWALSRKARPGEAARHPSGNIAGKGRAGRVTYFVYRMGSGVISCDCDGFKWSRRDVCRHVKSLQHFGILPDR
jgi:hypothetical protein